MAQKNDNAREEKTNLFDVTSKTEEAENSTLKDPILDENRMPSQQQEEDVIKKKCGGLLPKRPPLLSKDNERAFFDSADWALAENKGPLEALPRKLQPTRYQQIRSLSVYAREGSAGGDDQESTLDGDTENNDHSLNNQTHL